MRSRSLTAVNSLSLSRLEVVRRRLDQWRRTRPHRSRVPEDLWMSAVEVARRIGVSRTAGILRLNYCLLKRRVEISGEIQPAREAVEFMEVLAPRVQGGCECRIELEHPEGARMRMEIKGSAMPDLVALSRSFWGSRP
jgi:hypothetical protein